MAETPETPTRQPLILASSSPRRRKLLAEAGYTFRVVPPVEDVECGVCSESGPSGLVAELAYRKAASVVRHLQDSEANNSGNEIVLAADTVAECDGFILGKPRDEQEARAMLEQLRGREHRVLTGICLWPLEQSAISPMGIEKEWPLVRVAVTRLRMDPISDAQLEEYLNSGAWEGKAGAFGYQDRVGWIHIVEGSESNVVGLPMELLAELLATVGSGSGKEGKCP